MRTDQTGVPAEMKDASNRRGTKHIGRVQRWFERDHGVVSCTAEKKKLNVIKFDRTKGGVDVMDMMSGTYITRVKSQKWTLNLLSYVLDTVKTNSLTLGNEMNSKKANTHDFIWKFAEALG